ncbi:eCIS core domain-containing protein [Aeoliella mucimassa]|uniref:eCIS core domain-containing protein n=1 Tax=Aeoliella mucimassa TaxID=2527972 RepID=A0A518AMR0_9BACT|nr:DUF4157 domain-containing protein [Aeoliella mucimassa]QDU56017.1 hypothetical protein Pan181_22190 [Aeoliella mucimassa]
MPRLSHVSFLLIAGWLLTSSHGLAQLRLNDTTSLHFATAKQGREVLTARDDFVERLSPFDRAARLKSGEEVAEDQYLEFVGQQVREWSDVEQQHIAAAFATVQPMLESLDLPLPKEVLLIKTTGSEEGGAAYTRGNAIVLNNSHMAESPAMLNKLLCHELFHVLSRANPELREQLYDSIGFVACDEPQLPKELAARKITNPDAPKNDHCIRLSIDDQEQWMVPVLLSSSKRYDPQRGGEFFNYLEFKLLVVADPEAEKTTDESTPPAEAKLVDLRQASGFFEQVGNNTGYIIHPEEILADNFALLAMKREKLPSPEVTEKMAKILKKFSTHRAQQSPVESTEP